MLQHHTTQAPIRMSVVWLAQRTDSNSWDVHPMALTSFMREGVPLLNHLEILNQMEVGEANFLWDQYVQKTTKLLVRPK